MVTKPHEDRLLPMAGLKVVSKDSRTGLQLQGRRGQTLMVLDGAFFIRRRVRVVERCGQLAVAIPLAPTHCNGQPNVLEER